MLALAVGFAANAGTVMWEFWDDNATASSDYVLYLMEGSLTDGAVIAGITDNDTAATFVAGAVGFSDMDHTDALYTSGTSKDLAAGSKTFYAVIFNSSEVSTATEYLVVGKFDASVPSSGSASIGGDITDRTGASAGWQAVPEPTSGLLMLVGLGALALRRRRA
jgi:hypothetical protein